MTQGANSVPEIQVLLATYNGAEYLQQQIDSVLAQTYPNLQLLARDDGSRDRTRDLLEQAVAAHPDRIRLMPPEEGTGNAKWNFMRLMQASTAPYVALCDQDDVWLPDKLERCMKVMRQLEQRFGAEVPLLVFTDLKVVDRELHEIDPSFWAHQHIDADRIGSLPYMLAQNVVTGCTSLMNRALVERSLTMTDAAYMHDWWIALTVCTFGHAQALHQPTVLYRQHGANVVGAAIHGKRNLIPKLRYHEKRREQWEMGAQQAIAFLNVHKATLPPEARRIFEAYRRCETSTSRVERVYTFLRYGFFQKGLRPNLAMLWYLWDMDAARQQAAETS